MPAEIPLPIQYNPYKHHFRFLLSELIAWQKSDWLVTEKAMLAIGNNLFDFYLGYLTPEKVCEQSINFFKTNNIFSEAKFHKWLSTSEWKKIKFPDESEWLIKKGCQADRYIHIHPAKFSEHTIRVRANTLKTVLTLYVHKIPIREDNKQNLQAINQQRISFLNLSPIKLLDKEDSGILKLWQLFVDPDNCNYP